MTRWVRWLGLATVLTAAAVLSFHGLRDLAIAVSIPRELSWLLPVAVDAGAAVSCACWLSREIPPDAARFARTQTWLLLGGTVIGNAAQLGMHASAIVPPWWVAVLVGAIPPAVVGGTVHLAVLVGRPVGNESPSVLQVEPELGDSAVLEPPIEYWASTVPDRRTGRERSDGDIITEAREWAVELRRPPSRDEMLERFRIGAGRCRRLRLTLGWADASTEPTAVADR